MIVLHQSEPGARLFVDSLRARGVPTSGIRMRADIDPAAFARLAAQIRRAHPEILHTHLFHADVYGQLAGTAARIPVRISTKHGFNEFRERTPIRVADRLAGRLAQRQIAISRGLADYLAEVEGFDAETFEIVHYGIVATPPSTRGTHDRPRLLAVGRQIPIKGFDVLLDAFELARGELPGLTLDLAGDGPERGPLCAHAGAGVTFLGHVSPVGPEIERAAIVVVPSLGEGFGMVALEAMERGRAVIASDVGGLPEIVIDGQTGLLVPPGDAAALARAIVELAGDLDRARRMGEAGRRRALEVFPQERCVERTEAVYRAASADAAP